MWPSRHRTGSAVNSNQHARGDALTPRYRSVLYLLGHTPDRALLLLTLLPFGGVGWVIK